MSDHPGSRASWRRRKSTSETATHGEERGAPRRYGAQTDDGREGRSADSPSTEPAKCGRTPEPAGAEGVAPGRPCDGPCASSHACTSEATQRAASSPNGTGPGKVPARIRRYRWVRPKATSARTSHRRSKRIPTSAGTSSTRNVHTGSGGREPTGSMAERAANAPGEPRIQHVLVEATEATGIAPVQREPVAVLQPRDMRGRQRRAHTGVARAQHAHHTRMGERKAGVSRLRDGRTNCMIELLRKATAHRRRSETLEGLD